MSIATDIASLQIMSYVYKKKSLRDILQKTVHCLVEEVPYIHWVGIYFYENNKDACLVAASDVENDLTWEANGQLKFPIYISDEEKLGEMIVKTKEVIAFDITDLSTLETIAAEIGKLSLAN